MWEFLPMCKDRVLSGLKKNDLDECPALVTVSAA
jgi:hypothetical protein